MLRLRGASGHFTEGFKSIPQILLEMKESKINEYIRDTASSGFGVPWSVAGQDGSKMLCHLPLERLKLAISPTSRVFFTLFRGGFADEPEVMNLDLSLDTLPYLQHLDLNFNATILDYRSLESAGHLNPSYFP